MIDENHQHSRGSGLISLDSGGRACGPWWVRTEKRRIRNAQRLSSVVVADS